MNPDPVDDIPYREQLVLPLIEAVRTHGPLTPAEAATAVADILNLSRDARERTIVLTDKNGPRVENALRYNLRWVRQALFEEDIFSGGIKGLWTFSTQGSEFFVRAEPGVVVSVFENDLGTALCADVRSALHAVRDGSIQCYFSSPAYPIKRGRSYGKIKPEQAIRFVGGVMDLMRSKLTGDANVFLNLGYVVEAGLVQSTYVERILIALENMGYHLIQRIWWENPCKLPSGAGVTWDRGHLVEKVEPILRLSLSRTPRGDNRRLLEPYRATMLRNLAHGGDKSGPRPSGHGHFGKSFATDNGGAIPGNLFRVPHANSHAPHYTAITDLGLSPHPAQMPEAIIEPLMIMTTDVGDLVADLQAGNGAVQRVAQRLGRRFLYNDIHLNYAAAAGVHFEKTPGFRRFVDPVALQHAFTR